MKIQITVNGVLYTSEVDPTLRLLDYLRDVIGLTGTKEGCGEGECGACTVIHRGKAVASCLLMIGQMDGEEVTTIEGLAQDGTLSALQQSFVDHGAVQCGFCTPGMIMSAKALLDRNPHPTREEICIALDGNLCRCTGYIKIIKAIEAVARGDYA